MDVGPDPRAVAAAISADLSAAGVRHAVSGSVALAAHGYVRGTLDLDILVAVPATRLPGVFAILRARGFVGDDRELIASIRERHVATLSRGPFSVEVLVPVIPYHDALLARAVRLDVDGVSVPFVSAEDLAVLKMAWHRAKDVADVQVLVSARRGSIDAEYVRATLASLVPKGDARLREWDEICTRYRGVDPAG